MKNYTLQTIQKVIDAVAKSENRRISLPTKAYYSEKENRIHLEGCNISDFERVRNRVASRLSVKDVYHYSQKNDIDYIEII